jgi:hypothetical protein
MESVYSPKLFQRTGMSEGHGRTAANGAGDTPIGHPNPPLTVNRSRFAKSVT